MSHRPPDQRPLSQSDGPTRPLPAFRVILENSPGRELMGVVRAVMEVTRLCREEATHKMWESYHRGRSPLLVTHKERAELYVDQFAKLGITVTLEPCE